MVNCLTMIPEIGHFALIIAFCLAGLLALLPMIGLYHKNDVWMQAARPIALGQCFFILLSFMCLLYAFIHNDFSVAYVAGNSNAALPIFYKISAIWGGHEGSLLLWILIFSGWVFAVNVCSHQLPLVFVAKVFAVLGMIGFGFLLFLLTTSNPFARLLPNYSMDGNDLNPLLQDPGLIFHPPLLYMGYVGFSVPFAFAISVLWGNEQNMPWAKWMRPWVLSAFAFLTIGIALGSFWAYYELGWGGWWFWDPVENASFMPWLVSIALIHSLMVSDKRQLFQGWTLLLSIIVFVLSLLGTFLVRSGILTSVHAFATDPRRGIFLLEFLLVVAGSALLLYAIKGNKFSNPRKIDLFSREAMILFSTFLLIGGGASVLLGTIFPLIYDALTSQKISVGFPYFNAVFIPFMIPVLILIPLGPLSQWGPNSLKSMATKTGSLGALSIAFAFCVSLFSANPFSWGVSLGLGLGMWITLGTANFALIKIQKQGSIKRVSLGAWGMIFAHFGMAVLVIGITIVSNNEIEKEVEININQSVKLHDVEVVFKNLNTIEGPNYIGHKGHFQLEKNGQTISDLYPEKRIFVVQGSKMTETAIDPGLWRDIYIALADKLEKGKWSARIYYKPLVRWIWLGALLMAVGGFLAALGRRNTSKW